MDFLNIMNIAYQSHSKKLSTVSLFLVGGFISLPTMAAPNNDQLKSIESVAQLTVSPKPCVALHKGQKCYLEVTFSWQHPKINNYCLVNATLGKTIKCWKQSAKGKFIFDFQSISSNNFALRVQASEVDLAQTRIPVAWVYKSTKRAKSTWRLF